MVRVCIGVAILLGVSSSAFAQITPVIGDAPVVIGSTKKYHSFALHFTTPFSKCEGDPSSPFSDYRLAVLFQHVETRKNHLVQGHFAADGLSAYTGSTCGNQWRVLFTPRGSGTYVYVASFVQGPDVAIPNLFLPNPWPTGTPVHAINGNWGYIEIDDLTGNEPTEIRRGPLVHDTSNHYYHYENAAAIGEYPIFFANGAGSPETFLNYACFDNTEDLGGVISNALHDYLPHVNDWNGENLWVTRNPLCDPQWPGNQNAANGGVTTGKGIYGALNYLQSKGVNALYFLTLSYFGDGDDIWPWIDPDERDRFDVSKLDQWTFVLNEANKKGIQLKLFTQETENDYLLNGNNLGRERALYYRELVSRFGHALAVTWELGEENTNTDSGRKSFAEYIRFLDPYNHPITVHTYPNISDYEGVYGPLLGFEAFNGPDFQVGPNVTDIIVDWRNRSAATGHKWVLTTAELTQGMLPDSQDTNHFFERRYGLWETLTAGGGGFFAYYGFTFNWDCHDLLCNDFRERDAFYTQSEYLQEFLDATRAPLQLMNPDTTGSLTTAISSTNRLISKPGGQYIGYITNEFGFPANNINASIDLSGVSGTFAVRWIQPRYYGTPRTGSVGFVTGGAVRSLGDPPSGASGTDFVVYLRRL